MDLASQVNTLMRMVYARLAALLALIQPVAMDLLCSPPSTPIINLKFQQKWDANLAMMITRNFSLVKR